MLRSFETARRLNNDRLRRYPGSPLFQFADRQLDKIELVANNEGRITHQEYKDIDIGLMCARELEASDPEFCNVIYAMLEDVRPR